MHHNGHARAQAGEARLRAVAKIGAPTLYLHGREDGCIGPELAEGQARYFGSLKAEVLEGAGLITRGRHAQWRPCKLETKPLKEVDRWLAKYRAFWTGSFDRMDALLADLTKAPAKRRKQ